jgi:hypothetical protein
LETYWQATRKALIASFYQSATVDMPARTAYKLLRAYYENNGLYGVIFDMAQRVGAEAQALKPLRNPANRAVEFYAAKLWPGTLPDALPIIAGKESIVAPIQQVWKWSNWGTQKQVAARWFACYGDWFTKVVLRRGADTVSADTGGPVSGEPRSVYFQPIPAEHVTDLTADERGNLTYLRLDVPKGRREKGEYTTYMHTEVWDKATQLYRTWEHKHGEDAALDQLGTPARQAAFSEFDIDFIPVVHAKFRDVGEPRGWGCFTHCADKIDEANRAATRLHQMLWRHNKALWALSANMQDQAGRPMPAPATPKSPDDKVALNDSDDWVSLPGMATLQPLVPAINYDAALNILNAQIAEVEQDLPELAYYRLQESSDLSGVAIRTLLSAASDRLMEARGNAESALARLDAMALTIGQNAGLFAGIGDYDAGDFEHSFQARDPFPMALAEQAQTLMQFTTAGLPVTSALRMIGKSDAEIAEVTADRAAEPQSVGDAILQNFTNGGGDVAE